MAIPAVRARKITSTLRLPSIVLITALCLGQGTAQAANPVAAPMPGTPSFAYGNYNIAAQGYIVKEYSLSGNALSYTADGPPSPGGITPAKPAASAPYKTRVVVITPADPNKFNGTVVVEWLNVSGGQDAPADFVMLHRELFRDGYAYVGVSAQKIGIDGGPSLHAAPSLKKADPARYAGLVHPGDAYRFDIFSDTARLLKSQPSSLLGPLHPRHIIAIGDSQSAMYLAAYVNQIDPLAKIYDGFLIHSRPGFVPPLGSMPLMQTPINLLQIATPLLPTPRVPVLQLITETDLAGLGAAVGLYPVQQPDSANLRTWELTGAAHLDNYQLTAGRIDVLQLPIAQLAAAWAPISSPPQGNALPQPLNNGPQQHYVAEAALVKLTAWVATGTTPPSAGRINLSSVNTKGGLTGGLRTPWVDVPLTRLSGLPVTVFGMAGVAGASVPYDQAALASFYPGGRPQYLRDFQISLDETIKAGFILPADRQEILALAQLAYPKK